MSSMRENVPPPPPREGGEMLPRLCGVQGPRMSQGTHGLHGGSWRRKEASPQEVPEAPGATPLQEETQHRAGAWQCPNLGVEARTSPGEQNATSVRPQSLKASSRHPFYPQVVTEAQVAPVACREEEVASWTKAGPGGMFRSGHGGDRGGFCDGRGMD